MPTMDGYAATRVIRQEEKQKEQFHMPIIGVTDHVLERSKERCLSAGMDEYLAKPFSLDELRAKLLSCIG